MPKPPPITPHPEASLAPVLDFRGNPLQEEFVFSPDRRVAYAGAIRSGKTVGACARVLFHAQVYPGSQILVGRKFATDLEQTTLKELFRLVAAQNGGTYQKAGPLVVRYSGGNASHELYIRTKGLPSLINCRPCNEISKQLGLEISEYFIDQAEELDEDVFQHIQSRLSYWNRERTERFKAQYGYAPRTWETLTANPDPGWIKQLLFEYGVKDWTVFQTSIEQNRNNLDPEYIDNLYRTMPAEWVERFLRGSWDIRGGSVYKEFDEQVHCIEPFKIPAHWPRFLAHDWGISDRHRCVFLWGAVDESGRLYVVDELSVTNKLVSEVAEMVHAQTGQDRSWPREMDGGLVAVMDPATNQRHGTGRTVKGEFAIHKIYGRDANNDVNAGINKVAEKLHVDPRFGKPGLFIFKKKCPWLVRGLKLYQWIPANANGIAPGKPIKKDDDECLVGWTFVETRDGLRWLCTVKPGDEIRGMGGFHKVQVAKSTGQKKVMRVVFSEGSDLVGTGNHPIWVSSAATPGFVPMETLQPGDKVVSSRAKDVTVKTVIPAAEKELGTYPEMETVYNLKVEGGTYYANGVLTHNCDTLRYLLLDVLETTSDGAPPPSDNRDPFGDYVMKEFLLNPRY